MNTTAAVLTKTGQALEIRQLDIPVLKPGQVLVEISYSGVCHTQILECRGYRGNDRFLPHCLGHEGSGTVVETGEGVTRVRPGDKVILSWVKGSGHDVPGTVYSCEGEKVNAGAITTFQTHSVISENRLTVIPNNISMQEAALIGCAAPTGFGAVFNTAKARPGDSVAVFGAGGVGLCAIAAAAASGCVPVIAIDVNISKLSKAIEMGATEIIDASKADPVTAIRHSVAGGVDIAVESSGRPAVMMQALDCVRSQGGVAVIIGNAHFGETVILDPSMLNQGKSLLGTWGGDSRPDRDYGKYCRIVASGRIDLKPLISKIYPLEEINQAIADLENGITIRPLIDMKWNAKC